MYSENFLENGGEMGELIRSLDWSKTPLGTPGQWPLALKMHTRTMLDNKVGMYIAWGPEFTQIYNDAYRPILGADKHPRAMGISTMETFAEIWNIIGSMFADVMKGKSVGFPGFMLPLERNGFVEECFFDFSYSPIYHEDGYVGGVLVTVIETTQQVISLKNLHQSESNLRNLVLNAPIAMSVLKGPDYVVEIANDYIIDLWGTTRDEIMGNSIFDALPTGRNQDVEAHLNQVLKTGIRFSAKEHHMKVRVNDSLENIYVNYSYDPFRDLEGKIIGIIVVAIDVTEQVETRRKVEESEANLQRLVMSAPVAMCVFKEPDFKVEIANEPMLRLWGTTRDKVMKKPIFEGLPQAKDQGLEALLEGVFKTGVSFSANERPVILPRGSSLETVYVNFSYDPFKDSKGNITGIIAVAIDVTEQVTARQSIEQVEERARLAIESANMGTYDIDLKTNVMVTSDRFDEIYEVEKGSDRQVYINKYHPDDLQIRNRGMEEALLKGSTFFQLRIILKDGPVRWIRCNSSVFYDSHNIPIRLVGTVQDVSDIVNMQRHKDDFIAIASHELKTPLTSIKGYNHILESLIRKGDEVSSLNIIRKTERQIQKMIRLIHNFLDISKLESAQLKLEEEEFDLNDLISETINYHNLPENKERLRFNKTEVPEVRADRSKIAHVIDNLLSNALKYSPIQEKVIVTSSLEDHSIVVRVQDHGKGINESSKEKIFQRFYRADNAVGGTTSGFGIGLYFSSEIIRLHGGNIWFESQEGKGSTFYFSLPL